MHRVVIVVVSLAGALDDVVAVEAMRVRPAGIDVRGVGAHDRQRPRAPESGGQRRDGVRLTQRSPEGRCA